MGSTTRSHTPNSKPSPVKQTNERGWQLGKFCPHGRASRAARVLRRPGANRGSTWAASAPAPIRSHGPRVAREIPPNRNLLPRAHRAASNTCHSPPPLLNSLHRPRRRGEERRKGSSLRSMASMGSSELIYRGHEAQAVDGAGGYSAKPQKPLPRPLQYVLGEQRLVFAFVGMAVASIVFLLAPTGTPEAGTTTSVAHLAAVGLAARQYSSGAARMAYEEQRVRPGRVPLGLKRKGLRVVVTGGAGFVGSHLVDRLLARGDSVIVVDNFFTGRKENVLHHAGNANFEMIRHDVVEPILLEVDQIYHLACPASPVHYKHNPVKTIKTNVVGTLNMLGLAKRVGARFLLTSTSEVYGDPLQHPQVETYWGNVNPIGVRSCYDEGKRTAETLTMDYHRGANLEVRIARIFNTYGPRMCIDDGRVVSNFVAQALRKEPLTVYGDGKQTRSFQYVSDLVEGLMKLMEGEHVGPFNLGNPGEFTMLELAKVVQDTIDPNARIEFRPNTADDPHKRKPDISRAKELLGWEPKIPLNKGLPLMVQDFRDRIFGDQKTGAAAGDN